MAIYEYFCPTCRTRFERRRPMSEAHTATDCDRGHRAERTISTFATVRGGVDTLTLDSEAPGGCACGGACSCGA